MILLMPLIYTQAAASPSWTLHQLMIHNGSSVPTSQIENVMELKEGQKVTEKDVDTAISFLRKWGRFEKIEIEKKITSQGLNLYITRSR